MKARVEAGPVLVFAVVSLTCLLGLAAAATSAGTVFYAKQGLQIATGGAPIAGAPELRYANATAVYRDVMTTTYRDMMRTASGDVRVAYGAARVAAQAAWQTLRDMED